MTLADDRAVLASCAIASIVVAMLAISSNSLWVDEFGTWLLTRADSLGSWWRRLETWPDSDSQLPLYHLYMYLWSSVSGTNALAMRASNIALFLAANVALCWPFRSTPRIALLVGATGCLSAPLWYYLNEIRPYIMLHMGVCLMFGGAIEIASSRAQTRLIGLLMLCTGAVFSIGASVLGAAWVGAVLIFVVTYWVAVERRPIGELIGGHNAVLLVTGLCCLLVIAHDVRMILQGRNPTLLHDNSVSSVLFSFYANLGLLGVGPGMLDLRAHGPGALYPYLPIVVPAALVLGVVAVAGLQELRSRLGASTVALLIVCIALPILFTLAVGWMLHWRVLPRHLLPLVPLFSVLYAFGLTRILGQSPFGWAAAVLALSILAYSSLSVRYSARHNKDDYKYASGLTASELAQGGHVWWVADYRGLLYYGIPIVSDPRELRTAPGGRKAGLVVDTTFAAWSQQEPPTLVLVSRPDTYDRQGQVSRYLSSNGYRIAQTFPAFTAWRPPHRPAARSEAAPGRSTNE
jgi:hypothetical protein